MPHNPERHGPRRIVGPGFHSRVYAVVCRVPAGFVTTYGDVAEVLGSRSVARHVGFALAALPPHRADVPWHRVVNGSGSISLQDAVRQRQLLRADDIEVGDDNRVRDFASVRLPVQALEIREEC